VIGGGRVEHQSVQIAPDEPDTAWPAGTIAATRKGHEARAVSARQKH